MGNPTGFLEIGRQKQPTRPVAERLRDWREVYLPYESQALADQASRCMDCGIPFCHQGCPLGNLIPTWNDLVYRDRWREANDRLHATNNFPEMTGKLCPAPCEASCVLGLNDSPVDDQGDRGGDCRSGVRRGLDHARGRRRGAPASTSPSSAPAGRPGGGGAAQSRRTHRARCSSARIASAGCCATAFPSSSWRSGPRSPARADAAEGIVFRASCNVGIDVTADDLLSDFDAVVLAGGSTCRASCACPGATSTACIFAMDYLTAQNRRTKGTSFAGDEVIAAGKHVVIIGGGDTGADCLGTSLRQGAASVTQLELLPRPPEMRAADNPWPEWPRVFRVSSAHEEGGERLFAVSTESFLADEHGRVRSLRAVRVEPVTTGGRTQFTPVPESAFELPADLVLLAMGFTGPDRSGPVHQFGVRLTERGMVWRDANWMTSVPGVFTAGDMQRGQSLIVWAIADGRSCARGVDEFLMGESDLPAPV
jgi:glutamate synthase (NADPH/NADH) small chain